MIRTSLEFHGVFGIPPAVKWDQPPLPTDIRRATTTPVPPITRANARIAAGAFGPVASVMRQPSFIRKRSFSGERKGNGYTINRFGDTTIMTEGNAQTGSSGHGTR